MNILVDFHHEGLLDSLHRLFELRLGHNLYRPIGMDWFTNGFWKIGDPYPNPEVTAKQFLQTGSVPTDGTHPLNNAPTYFDGEPQKLVTFTEMQQMQFDIVIASYIHHIKPYQTLIQLYQPKAKLIHQMGNDWKDAVDFTVAKNILASTAEFSVPQGVNAIFYHQEFDLNIFKPRPVSGKKKICSFTNVMRDFPQDYQMHQSYKENMPDWEFKAYGASNPDGGVDQFTIAEEMADSMFGWHLKTGGDGFGHVIHNWFACGRPPIVRMSQYRGQLAGKLMEDEVTCINIDNLSTFEGIAKIEHYSDPKRHETLVKNAHKRFTEIVDYDAEQLAIVKFLQELV